MRLKNRKKTCLAAVCVCLMGLLAAGFAKAEDNVVVAEDLDAFVEAAVAAAEEDEWDKKEPDNAWQNKRLLVISETEFDAMGASQVISGYGNLYILDYASEKATKKAYRALKKIPGLKVEADYSYSGAAKWVGAAAKEYAGNPSKEKKKEGKKSEEKDVVVAVIDTGYGAKQEKRGRVQEGVDLTASGGTADANGHGSAMADIILSHTGERVKIMPVKAADADGVTSTLKLYLGICYATEHKADLIQISMSAYKAPHSAALCEAIKEAGRKGIPVIVSAGNAGGDTSDFSPANIKEAITVSAVGADKKIAEYSNRGDDVDFCAYGTAEAQAGSGAHKKMEGTSVSAALVSAVAAGYMAERPTCTYQELFDDLKERAKDLGEDGWDALYGHGLLAPDSALQPEEPKKEEESGKEKTLLSCDWKAISDRELNAYIGAATSLERRVFLDRLKEAEQKLLLGRKTLFTERVLYSESAFDAKGNTTETFRMQGRLYDIMQSKAYTDRYEIQSRYHIFAYGSNTGTRSCIRLDTEANTNPATIYCWMKDRSTDDQNSGEYGILFVPGSSAYDFSESVHKIENCDRADSGNPLVWRLKIRNVKVRKPAARAVDFDASLWNKSTYQLAGTQISGLKAHYWYIYHYQVKPASDAARQRAYGDGAYHGGFWDLADASGKRCGSTEVTTSVDIGSRDLYTDGQRDGIVYRLPLTEHVSLASQKTVLDTEATCVQKGVCHVETSYTCDACERTWKETGGLQETPQLLHAYAPNTAENNGIANGIYWEACTRNCGGYDGAGAYWQRNVRYLQPVRIWEMDTEGNYPALPSGTDRENAYYAAGESVLQWERAETDELLAGRIEAFAALDHAAYHDVYIRRKRYTVVYDGNGAERGHTDPQNVYFGQSFDLRENGFTRRGHTTRGWSLTPSGAVLSETGVKNLSDAHQGVVTLYARWRPCVYQVTLDHQGADQSPGTQFVYEKYGIGYYQRPGGTQLFPERKIEIPKKNAADDGLPGGLRRQKFLGYYTQPDGKGHLMIQPDGEMLASINGSGAFAYFSMDGTVYAKWEDMHMIRFDPNLSKEEMDLFESLNPEKEKEPVVCPSPRWKEKGEDVTVSYADTILRHKTLAACYRLKGYSLTPEIDSDSELVLSRDRRAHTITKEQDVTLYAQWDTDFIIAYMGNGQDAGRNFLSMKGDMARMHVLARNCFTKTKKRPTVDVSSGRTLQESGDPYMETVPFGFYGWSMQMEKEKQMQEEIYRSEDLDDVERSGRELIFAAVKREEEGNGGILTFGGPADGFGPLTAEEAEEVRPNLPFLNLYAVWDEYPQIHAADQYLPLSDAQNGVLTEAYLLRLARATDAELKTDANSDGVMKHGTDAAGRTSFTIPDYQTEDFTGAEEDMRLTITYRAEDAAGHVTTKIVRITLTDTSGEAYDDGTVRFISEKHMDTLAKDSIWRSGNYAKALARALNNRKSEEEYTSVTPVQRAFGMQPVVKPGSGAWDHVQEIWKFDHVTVRQIQAYIEAGGEKEGSSGFLEKFGNCRVR